MPTLLGWLQASSLTAVNSHVPGLGIPGFRAERLGRKGASRHSSLAQRDRFCLGAPGTLAVGDAGGSVTCLLGCSSMAQPQPQPMPPGTMSRPSWPPSGTVQPDSIIAWDAFPTVSLASHSFTAAAGCPSLPSSSPPTPSYYRATKSSCEVPSQQLQFPVSGISEFPGLHWKAQSPLPTPFFCLSLC